ncbi:Hypothetical predicted protein [Pelobates cultripes]|nr:Hypothetical predicted protein [Pelobates cultripes]
MSKKRSEKKGGELRTDWISPQEIWSQTGDELKGKLLSYLPSYLLSLSPSRLFITMQHYGEIEEAKMAFCLLTRKRKDTLFYFNRNCQFSWLIFSICVLFYC